jgi:hypothetical protein
MFSVTCYGKTDVDAAILLEQPFLNLLERGQIVSDVRYSRSNKSFAMMGIGDIDSVDGAESLWQKVNGTWGIIAQGQNYPLCSLVDGKGVPKDLVAQCIDGGTTRGIK